MDTFQKRMAIAVKLAGGQSALARFLSEKKGQEIRPQLIQFMIDENRQKPPQGSALVPLIALKSGVNAVWLSDGIGDQFADTTKYLQKPLQDWRAEQPIKPYQKYTAPKPEQYVPEVSWVNAGNFSDHNHHINTHEAPRHPKPPDSGSRTFALRVRGASMENLGSRISYSDNDVIYVDPDRPASHNDHVIVCLAGNHEATFKQLIIEGSERYLKALNPHWPTPIIPLPADAAIAGVVIYMLRKN